MAENCLESESSDGGPEGCTVERSDLGGMSLGVAVPAAVASRTGANVLDLDPLWGVVDVDTLDQIWGPEGSSQWDDRTRVSFPYMGYEVTVTPEVLHLEPIAVDRDAGGDPSASG